MTKRIPNGYPDDTEGTSNISVTNQRVVYSQLADTDQSSDDSQFLSFEIVTTDVAKEGGDNQSFFVRMSTHPGGEHDFWSLDGLEELVDIYNDFLARLNVKYRYNITKEEAAE